jgi:hypothetical protein
MHVGIDLHEAPTLARSGYECGVCEMHIVLRFFGIYLLLARRLQIASLFEIITCGLSSVYVEPLLGIAQSFHLRKKAVSQYLKNLLLNFPF